LTLAVSSTQRLDIQQLKHLKQPAKVPALPTAFTQNATALIQFVNRNSNGSSSGESNGDSQSNSAYPQWVWIVAITASVLFAFMSVTVILFYRRIRDFFVPRPSICELRR
jgi:hypothetical protein